MSKLESQQLGQFIPLHYHYQMLHDRARVLAFKTALGKVAPLGGHVIELGSGTGVLSFFAAQRAARVTSVEFNSALVRASRQFLTLNGVADRVTVEHADATTFLPQQPADLVVCEMLHSALLREKQVEVIQKFKACYLSRFGKLPRFMPEATVLAVQPIDQNYNFQGYEAAVPFFQDAAVDAPDSVAVAGPLAYATINYSEDMDRQFDARMRFTAGRDAKVNALRFITKNLLAILPDEQRSIDWHNQHLVIPLPETLAVQAGSVLEFSFSYEAGSPIETLSSSLQCVLVAR